MFLNKKSLFFKVALAIVFSCVTFFEHVNAQTLSDSVLNNIIKQAILEKNAKDLSSCFHPKVDLVLLENRGIYSKVQAQFVLATFFEEYIPSSFEVISQSINGKSNFVIGKMHTDKRHFRVCYLIKEEAEQKTIYQFRIEE